MPGPPPKPTALKLLAGNPGKRKLNEKEPKPKSAPKLMPPAWLHKDAKVEWRRIAPKLAKLDLLSEIDRMALAAYCQCYARWKEAEEYLSQNGATFESYTDEGETKYVGQVPQVAIALNMLKQMKAFLTEFGMTPATRTRISVDLEDNKPDALDQWQADKRRAG